jgi:hypothetical protein
LITLSSTQTLHHFSIHVRCAGTLPAFSILAGA